jgi:D-lactate dehydrogenase
VALLEPKTERIAPAAPQPAADRAPDWVAAGTPEPLRSELTTLLGSDRVLTRALDLVRYASDASPYRLFPKAVVMARDVADVAKVLALAHQTATPVVFRSGGTSLNGQSQGDGILVDVRRHWRGIAVEDDGARARVKPGTVLGHANRALVRYDRKLGPDPASTDFATVGGVVANNSGGMRCGVTQDSYSTVASMTFVLPSGTVIDTAAPDAEAAFAAAEPELAAGLEQLREEIRGDAELSARIARKFEIKNTTGYRLCAFLDAASPLEIFRRLLIGSEGTLAFIAEVVFDTVPLGRHTSTGLFFFDDVDAAADAVPAMVATGATATELMVAPTLITAAYNMPGTPERWRELPFESAALLVEFRADAPEGLEAPEAEALEALRERTLIDAPEFTRDHAITEMRWRVREGMFGLVGAIRPAGSSLLTEDVCVRPERVAEAVNDIRALLGKHEFLPGVAGHASAGNLHFLLTPVFGEQADRERYEAFMGELVDLIVDKYDGSLKAEHGTGLNMAPFVEREWGKKATELMWRVKELADPHAVLGPGVVLNRDPEVHLANLKSNPEIEEVADKCVECGFCEPVCPSRHLTTTPRQRIVLRREMTRQPAGSPVLGALLDQYEYDGLQTCAADGTCMLVCPVGIDTGKLVKGFRAREHSPRAERAALAVAKRWATVERAARASLRAGHATGGRPARAAASLLRAAVSSELVPVWPESMPPPAAAELPPTRRRDAAAVYLPACVNRIFGSPEGAGMSLPAALVAVSERAGHPLWIPAEAPGHCCATPWTSKGYRDGARHMADRLVESLWRWTEHGALPVVMDASSCALGVASEIAGDLSAENAERHAQLRILDSVAWARETLLGDLEVSRRLGAVALHPPCATRHLGLDGDLAALAAELADEVVVPAGGTCCGMAGDRGMLHPELPAAALADAAAELEGRDFDARLCSNRTCEIALSEHTSGEYQSFVFALEALTRPRVSRRERSG